MCAAYHAYHFLSQRCYCAMLHQIIVGRNSTKTTNSWHIVHVTSTVSLHHSEGAGGGQPAVHYKRQHQGGGGGGGWWWWVVVVEGAAAGGGGGAGGEVKPHYYRVHVSFLPLVEGILVPDSAGSLRELSSEARFVLIVEKDATFQKLIESHFLRLFGPCILITASLQASTQQTPKAFPYEPKL